MAITKLQNYCMRYDILKSAMKDDVYTLLEQYDVLESAWDIVENEKYEVLTKESIKVFCETTLAVIKDNMMLRQKVQVDLETIQLIQQRIKKMATQYIGLIDALGLMNDITITNDTLETLKDTETVTKLKQAVLKIYEELA